MQRARLLPALVATLLVLTHAQPAHAVNIAVALQGVVTNVQDSTFASGPTMGIAPGEHLQVSLTYDNTTGQSSGGDLISYEIVNLLISVPDDTQAGESFDMVPAELNSATRIVFDAADDFHGLLLPTNVTGFENLVAFGVSDVDFESEGLGGNEFKFNVGTPIVEGFFRFPAPPSVPALGSYGFAALAGVLLLLLYAVRRKAA